jgi:hypothetical protein
MMLVTEKIILAYTFSIKRKCHIQHVFVEARRHSKLLSGIRYPGLAIGYSDRPIMVSYVSHGEFRNNT